jgi:CO/xanthine dehydrogenase FAD-binding subunit
MDARAAYYPRELGDFLGLVARYGNGSIVGGGIESIRLGERLPQSIVAMDRVEELRSVGRNERFLELGAGMSLQGIRDLGEGNLPQVLLDSIDSIGRPLLIPLASLAGTLCARQRRLDPFAAFSALDAKAELRSLSSSRWLPVARLFSESGDALIKPNEALLRVRIPLVSWDIAIHRKVGCPGSLGDHSGSFCFLLQAGKNTVSDIRVTYAGKVTLRSKELEAGIQGRRIPIHDRDGASIIAAYEKAAEAAGFSASELKVFSRLLAYCLSLIA